MKLQKVQNNKNQTFVHVRSRVPFPGRSNRTQWHQLLTTAAASRTFVARTLCRGSEPGHLLHASAQYREYNKD